MRARCSAKAAWTIRNAKPMKAQHPFSLRMR
jgi:hypothetical protein